MNRWRNAAQHIMKNKNTRWEYIAFLYHINHISSVLSILMVANLINFRMNCLVLSFVINIMPHLTHIFLIALRWEKYSRNLVSKKRCWNIHWLFPIQWEFLFEMDSDCDCIKLGEGVCFVNFSLRRKGSNIMGRFHRRICTQTWFVGNTSTISQYIPPAESRFFSFFFKLNSRGKQNPHKK